MFPVDSITLGILCGENYNSIRVLADLFVMLEYSMSMSWHGCGHHRAPARVPDQTFAVHYRAVPRLVRGHSSALRWYAGNCNCIGPSWIALALELLLFLT